jgi:hypothetical protein
LRLYGVTVIHVPYPSKARRDGCPKTRLPVVFPINCTEQEERKDSLCFLGFGESYLYAPSIPPVLFSQSSPTSRFDHRCRCIIGQPFLALSTRYGFGFADEKVTPWLLRRGWVFCLSSSALLLGQRMVCPGHPGQSASPSSLKALNQRARWGICAQDGLPLCRFQGWWARRGGIRFGKFGINKMSVVV